MISTPLHAIGDALREALLQVPLPIVRLVFLAMLAGLLLWVLRLPSSVTTDPRSRGRGGSNLKVGAAIALALQLAIYSLF